MSRKSALDNWPTTPPVWPTDENVPGQRKRREPGRPSERKYVRVQVSVAALAEALDAAEDPTKTLASAAYRIRRDAPHTTMVVELVLDKNGAIVEGHFDPSDSGEHGRGPLGGLKP